MNKRLTPRTLAAYLGSSCECEEYFRNGRPAGGGSWRQVKKPLTLNTAHLITTIGYRNAVLILRPLDSMSGSEAGEVAIDRARGNLDNWTEMAARTTDLLRSKGFDLGGWIEERKEGMRRGFSSTAIIHTEQWTRKWVPSLIDEGLAKAPEK